MIPNILTFLRLSLVVPFVILFYVDAWWAHGVAAILFCSACITDYFDGYLARSLNQMSTLGRCLDPVADKVLIATALLMLAGFGRLKGIELIPAVIILCRELTLSGVREFLATVNEHVPVHVLSKWKTAIQMVALSFLLLNPPYGHMLGIVLLWIAAVLTMVTGVQYLLSLRGKIHE